jgi:hypothetical protein
VDILPSGLEGVAPGLSKLENGLVSGTKLIARPQLTGSVKEEKAVAAASPAVQKQNGKISKEETPVKRKSFLKRLIS